MNQPLTVGYSPCPNDTFMFHALAHGTVEVDRYRVAPVLHDVETLNQMAGDGILDVSKLSVYAWLANRERYQMLSSGAAMGFGCGPILIAKRPLSASAIETCRVVLPGRWTTAHLLFRLWAPHARQRRFVSYDRIFDWLAADRADCGVIIHESRFTFAASGFYMVVDLGAWWEAQTDLPIPLGCIAARNALGRPLIEQIDAAVRRSIDLAMAEPDATLPYIRQYAQEIDDAVLRAHIRTFVNDFSLDITAQGRRAIDTLESMARKAGVL